MRKKFMFVSIALLVCLAPWGAAFAADSNAVIDLGVARGADIPPGTYTNWSYSDTTVPPSYQVNADVEVINSGLPFSSEIGFDIDPGATVDWKADMSGSTPDNLLTVTGAGAFEVTDGQIINGNASGTSCAISASGNVRVSGGTVSAAGGYAIYTSGNVTISGGLVFAYGSEIATKYTASTSADMNAVIYMLEGRDGKQGKFNNPTDNGIVVAWNAAKGARTYTAGTMTDLTTDPAGAAEWGIDGNNGGIRYGGNGFFMIPNITVNSP